MASNYHLNVEPYCEMCPDFEPTCQYQEYYVDGRRFTISHEIHCANHERCARIYKAMKEDYEEEHNDDSNK